MKRSVKITLTAGGAAVILGLIICLVGLAMADFDFSRLSWTWGDYEKTELSYAAGEIGRISVSVSADDVFVTRSDNGEVGLVYYSGEFEGYEAELESGGLSLKSRELKARRWYEYLVVNFGSGAPAYGVELRLPEGFSGEVELETGSGDVIIDGAELNGALRVSAGAGDIRAEGVTAADTELTAGAGDVVCALIGKPGDYAISAEAALGDTEIEGAEAGASDTDAGKTVRITAARGDIAVSFR